MYTFLLRGNYYRENFYVIRKFVSGTLSWEDIFSHLKSRVAIKTFTLFMTIRHLLWQVFKKDIYKFTGKEGFCRRLEQRTFYWKWGTLAVFHTLWRLCNNKYEHKYASSQKQRWGSLYSHSQIFWKFNDCTERHCWVTRPLEFELRQSKDPSVVRVYSYLDNM